MIKDEYCKGCPLAKAPYVKPQLRVDSDILFVGQSPEANSILTGYPLCHKDKAGKLLRKYTDLLKLKYSVTNCVLCFTKGTPKKKEIDYCKPKLEEAIAYTKPKLIVPLGKPAVYAITGRRDSILKLNGKLIDGNVIPCVHPSYVTLYDRDEGIFEKGILPAINHFAEESKLEIKKRDIVLPKDIEVGFDIETSSLRPDGKLKCFAISDGKSAIFVEVEDE